MFLTDGEMPCGSLDRMQLCFPVWSMYSKKTCSCFALIWCFCCSVISYSFWGPFWLFHCQRIPMKVTSKYVQDLYFLSSICMPNVFLALNFCGITNVTPLLPSLWNAFLFKLAPKAQANFPFSLIFVLPCRTLQCLASSDNALKICLLLLNSPSSLQNPSFAVQCIILSF